MVKCDHKNAVTKVVSPEVFVLTLSPKEAHFLLDFFGGLSTYEVAERLTKGDCSEFRDRYDDALYEIWEAIKGSLKEEVKI